MSQQPLSPGRRRYAMGLLLTVAILNYLDRSIIQILGEPIKRELGLADWQLGVMSGLAFGVLYTLLGIPLARIAERHNRSYLIAASVGVWSFFTLLCGYVQTFWQLAAARIGVGMGEAGCNPPSFSLVMDYAPPERRSSALAFFGLGPPMGGLIGLAFGGLVADAYGWRTAFLLAGLPGLLLAVVVAITLPEPRKLLARQTGRVQQASATLGQTLRLLLSRRSYRYLAAALTLKVFIFLGYAPFIASFYLRNHTSQLDAAAAATGTLVGATLGPIGFLGLALGLLNGVGAGLGTWWGGWIADRLGARNARNLGYAPAIAALVTVPAFIAAMAVTDIRLSLALYAVHSFAASVYYGPTWAAVLSVTPAHMRATSSALLLFLSNLIGLGLGPVGVGLLSDALGQHLGSGEGLRVALILLSVVGLLAALAYWTSARTLVEDAAATADAR